jgi:glycosyltransferase involved in cell wall biosynthesis
MNLSVALCTFNGAAHLKAQLESVAAQTCPPDELVVSDDASTDDTPRIVEAFARVAHFPVRLTVNEQTLGSTRNFERAISLCSGDVIALCDQDDVWLSQKLLRLEGPFSDPAVGLAFSDAEIVDESLRPTGRRLWDAVGLTAKRRRQIGRGRQLGMLLCGYRVTGATMAVRAKYARLAVPVPDGLGMIHDGWIALVAGAKSRVVAVAEPLVLYRQHARQQLGAPPPQRADAPAVPWRANDYETPLRTIEALLARLESEGEWGAGVHELRCWRDHLLARASMPRGRLRRLPTIISELPNYRLYGRGVLSAAKDALA